MYLNVQNSEKKFSNYFFFLYFLAEKWPVAQKKMHKKNKHDDVETCISHYLKM